MIYFKNFLLQAYRSHKKVLLIIDEAQRLNHDILQEIRFLGNIDFGGQMMINIFLVGQNEFKDILLDERNKSDNMLVKKQGIIESSNALRPQKRSAELSSAVMPTSQRSLAVSKQEQIITPKDILKNPDLSYRSAKRCL